MRTLLKLLTAVVMPLLGITAGHAQQQAVVADTIQHGQILISPVEPVAGQNVTVTVIPDPGYEIKKSDISVERTIAPGYAQTPARMPQVGYYIDLSGETPTDPGQQTDYSFVMPDEPFGVFITGTFKRASYTGIDSLTDAAVTRITYVSPAGIVSDSPMPGVNIVVVAYTNGTRSATKQVF